MPRLRRHVLGVVFVLYFVRDVVGIAVSVMAPQQSRALRLPLLVEVIECRVKS